MHSSWYTSSSHECTSSAAAGYVARFVLPQDTALTSLKVSAQLCGELLAECHAAPPEALLTAAMQLHDHALLVSICAGCCSKRQQSYRKLQRGRSVGCAQLEWCQCAQQ